MRCALKLQQCILIKEGRKSVHSGGGAKPVETSHWSRVCVCAKRDTHTTRNDKLRARASKHCNTWSSAPWLAGKRCARTRQFHLSCCGGRTRRRSLCGALAALRWPSQPPPFVCAAMEQRRMSLTLDAGARAQKRLSALVLILNRVWIEFG